MNNIDPQTMIIMIEHFKNNYDCFLNYWIAQPATECLVDYIRLRLIQDGFDSNTVDYFLEQEDIYNELSIIHPNFLN